MLSSFSTGIRKYERWIIFGILVVTALAFGITSEMMDVMGGKGKDSMAGKIFGQDVAITDFTQYRARWSAWTDWLLQHFQPMILNYLPPYDTLDAEDFQKNREEYLNDLTWNAMILNKLAGKAGITVSDDEVSQYIKSSPLLSDKEKGFMPDAYRSLLMQLRTTSEAFEQTAAEALKIGKYRNFIVNTITASTEEAFTEYLAKNDEIKLRWVAFKSDDYLGRIKNHTPEEIKNYYEQNAHKYEIPLKVRMEYIFAANESLKKNVPEPAETALTEEYNKYKDNEPYKGKTFNDVKAQVRGKVIDAAAGRLAIEQMARVEEKITTLTLQDKTISLEALAKEFNLSYQETGWFSTDRLNEIEKEIGVSTFLRKQITAFQENEISNSITTDKGSLLFRMLGAKDSYLPKLTAQLQEKVVNDLSKEKAAKSAEGAAHRLTQSITDKVAELNKSITPTDAAYAETMTKTRKEWFANFTQDAFTVKTTDYFKSEGPVQLAENLGPQSLESLFKLQEGEFTVVAEKAADGKRDIYYIAQVLNRRPAAPSDFYTRQKELTQSVTEDKQQKFLKEWKVALRRDAGWESYSTKK